MKNEPKYKIKFDPEIYKLLRDTGTDFKLLAIFGKIKKPLRLVKIAVWEQGTLYTFEYASTYHKWRQIVISKDGARIVGGGGEVEVILEWNKSILEKYV